MNITEVYPLGRSYLKGFFNVIEAWREGRDLKGWKLEKVMEEAGKMDAREAPLIEFSKGYSVSTHITVELGLHARALAELIRDPSPLMVPLRPIDAHKIRYVAGDASAEGFFIVTQYPDAEPVRGYGMTPSPQGVQI